MGSEIEILRKKLLYKSWNRGCKETDIILGEFAKRMIETLSDKELKSLEIILQYPDNIIYAAAVGRISIPEEFNAQLFNRIIQFNQRRIHEHK